MDTIKKSLTNLQNSLNNKSVMSPSNIISENKVSSNVSTDSINPVTSIRRKSGILDSISNKSSNVVSNFMDHKIIAIIVLVVIILAILGFNLFKFLGKGTDNIASFLKPIFGDVGKVTGDTAKTTVSGVSDGTKKIVHSSSNVVTNVIDGVDSGTTDGINLLENTLKKDSSVVNTENNDTVTDKVKFDPDDEPEPVKSTNQQGGYCYVGKINDTRHCAKVTNKSLCMSGDIYPTKDLCVNPGVRN